MSERNFERELSQLVSIGIGLTSTRSLDDLLEQIVHDAREFTRCDAGSLYLVEGDRLRFAVAQNDTLERRGTTAAQGRFLGKYVEISDESMAGYVAGTGTTLNIKDAYDLDPNLAFTINKDFDQANDFRTTSLLLVPMKNREGKTLGVLQLINALDEFGEVTAFESSSENMVQALASQAAVAVENVQLTERLKQAYFQVIIALCAAAEYKDADTALHLKRMSLYSELVAKNLGLSKREQEMILYASPMHDVGKIGIPDAILQKPGALTHQERLEIENHTIYGADIIARANPGNEEMLKEAETIAISHHEKVDGTGYPKKLRNEKIPISGRIVALADVFDALTSKRCYKPAFPVEQVLDMIKESRGKHFDPAVVDAFFAGEEQVKAIHSQYQGGAK
ncbi:MAG TPA: GAF domain-containing protein [bacterium]|nr:GAF domain-containing protein [bacterium]